MICPVDPESVVEACVPTQNLSEYRSCMNVTMISSYENYFSAGFELFNLGDTCSYLDTYEAESVIVAVEQLEAGLRFPLDQIFIDLCTTYNFPLSQLHPNSIRQVCVLSEICRRAKLTLSLDRLRSFFLVTKRLRITPFVMLAARVRRALSGNLPESIKSLGPNFFRVKHPSLRGLPAQWNFVDLKPFTNIFKVPGDATPDGKFALKFLGRLYATIGAKLNVKYFIKEYLKGRSRGLFGGLNSVLTDEGRFLVLN